MQTLTKIDVMSWAKVQAVLAMLLVAIMGVLNFTVFSLIFSGLNESVEMMGRTVNFGGLAGVGFIGFLLFIPLLGLFAFVFGLIGGLLFNLVLKWVGGIKYESH